MSASRDLDAYSDAVLVAILRFLVARGSERNSPLGDREPTDGILTFIGVETVDDLVRRSQAVALFQGDKAIDSSEAYKGYRHTIDPLWAYVDRYGLDALAEEVRERLGARQAPNLGRNGLRR